MGEEQLTIFDYMEEKKREKDYDDFSQYMNPPEGEEDER